MYTIRFGLSWLTADGTFARDFTRSQWFGSISELILFLQSENIPVVDGMKFIYE